MYYHHPRFSSVSFWVAFGCTQVSKFIHSECMFVFMPFDGFLNKLYIAFLFAYPRFYSKPYLWTACRFQCKISNSFIPTTFCTTVSLPKNYRDGLKCVRILVENPYKAVALSCPSIKMWSFLYYRKDVGLSKSLDRRIGVAEGWGWWILCSALKVLLQCP